VAEFGEGKKGSSTHTFVNRIWWKRHPTHPFVSLGKIKYPLRLIMPFTQTDFNRENAQRLSVIVMKQMEKPILTSFRSLGTSQQTKFNRLMNQYIQSLPEEWEPKLLADFDQIVNEDLLVDEFDPSTVFIPMLNTEPELLLTEEQKTFLEEERIRRGEDTIRV